MRKGKVSRERERVTEWWVEMEGEREGSWRRGERGRKAKEERKKGIRGSVQKKRRKTETWNL